MSTRGWKETNADVHRQKGIFGQQGPAAEMRDNGAKRMETAEKVEGRRGKQEKKTSKCLFEF